MIIDEIFFDNKFWKNKILINKIQKYYEHFLRSSFNGYSHAFVGTLLTGIKTFEA